MLVIMEDFYCKGETPAFPFFFETIEPVAEAPVPRKSHIVEAPLYCFLSLLFLLGFSAAGSFFYPFPAAHFSDLFFGLTPPRLVSLFFSDSSLFFFSFTNLFLSPM